MFFFGEDERLLREIVMKSTNKNKTCDLKMRWFICIILIIQSCVRAQDLSACCSKGDDTCMNVCVKMSSVEKTTDSPTRDDRIQNIHKFCGPHLTDFWMCMNQTIKEIVQGLGWWGRVCCSRGRSPACRQACVTAPNAGTLQNSCRKSDELDLFECVQMQQEAQWCCSQTVSLSCHEACYQALWRIGQNQVDSDAKERVLDVCDQSRDLLQCFRNFTSSVIHSNLAKYASCCAEAPNPECSKACREILVKSKSTDEIFEGLVKECHAPALIDPFWKCILRKDEPSNGLDIMPRDGGKLNCCSKATTLMCKRICFLTFDSGWQSNWKQFEVECVDNPQEIRLAKCIEEIQAPCSLGCDGLTYCTQMNNRPTTLFRSCNAESDLGAHIAVANQHESGFVELAGIQLPLRNTSQCPTDLWKSVACLLYVKPCTRKGQSSLLCPADCYHVVSACVDWPRAEAHLTARSVCDKLAPVSESDGCVQRTEFSLPSTIPALLSPTEAVRSPCAGSPCNSKEICVVKRNCPLGSNCPKFACVAGCPLGVYGTVVVPIGSWVRIVMSTDPRRACYKVCYCGPHGLTNCQPMPCYSLSPCVIHDKIASHGQKFYIECNECTCVAGERVCAGRTCGSSHSTLLTRLPCNCPPHHLPVYTFSKTYPNACLAKCAGATDFEIEFSYKAICSTVTCNGVCLERPTIYLSHQQKSVQYECVRTKNCSNQPLDPICDTEGYTHANPCAMLLNRKKLNYWGECQQGCLKMGIVCGINGVTYNSECAAWAEYVSVDYPGPCLAVGPVTNAMEPKCLFDRIICPALKKPKCLGFTAPGACCPKCGGALRILYSNKQFDRAVYATNFTENVVTLHNILKALERHVTIAECVLRGYLSIEMEIFLSVESVLEHPTDLQLEVCVLEAEKIADLINRESVLITSDLVLSALSYALVVHTYAAKAAIAFSMSVTTLVFSAALCLILR